MGQIIQESIYIPDDVVEGLLSGLFKRFGGVVRYATGPHKGEIYKHLKPLQNQAKNDMTETVQKASNFIREHRTGIIVTAVGVGIFTAGGIVYFKLKNRIPRAIKEFKNELIKYIDSIRNATLSVEQIDSLLASLETLKQQKNYDKIIVKLSAPEIFAIAEYICDYTIKLVKDNAVDVDEDEINACYSDNLIISLDNFLKAQKKVFESSA